MRLRATTCGLMMSAVLALGGAARADDVQADDAGLTAQAKAALRTLEGVSVRGTQVETLNGKVTLRGTVGSHAEKEKASSAVIEIEGVRAVFNRLQVVPSSVRATERPAADKRVASNDATPARK